MHKYIWCSTYELWSDICFIRESISLCFCYKCKIIVLSSNVIICLMWLSEFSGVVLCSSKIPSLKLFILWKKEILESLSSSRKLFLKLLNCSSTWFYSLCPFSYSKGRHSRFIIALRMINLFSIRIFTISLKFSMDIS